MRSQKIKMADGKLSGKTAIVTGAGRGLGRSMALGLARAGANVMLTAARNRREIDMVAEEAARSPTAGAVRPLLADVANEEDCARVVSETVSEFGGVHILVNNAGRGMRFVSEKFFDTPTKFWETDPTVWKMIIDTNVNGPFLMARAAAPHMMKQRWGRIVNISMNHETMRRAGFSPYGPSKAALESETIIWVAPHLRQQLLPPDIMVPPLLWLVSEQASGVSGSRFDANLWDAALPPRQAAEKSRTTAGWIPQTA